MPNKEKVRNMTEKELFTLLRDMLEKIDEDEYPEICEVISENLDYDDEDVFCGEFEIVQQLSDADNTKQIPECVAKFMCSVYEKEIEQGNAGAACDIGALYYTGRIGEQSFEKAVKYYKISADGGCRQAQENLGYCYYYGRDVEVDYKKAFHYFALGAFDGHICSLYKIGDMYRNGYYVKKNTSEAFSIYKRCYELLCEGNIPFVGADVMMRMGDCYFQGIGTDVDYKAALEFYQNAENLFYERLERGDYLIKGCYEKVIRRQGEARQKLNESLPQYNWTK